MGAAIIKEGIPLLKDLFKKKPTPKPTTPQTPKPTTPPNGVPRDEWEKDREELRKLIESLIKRIDKLEGKKGTAMPPWGSGGGSNGSNSSGPMPMPMVCM